MILYVILDDVDQWCIFLYNVKDLLELDQNHYEKKK